MTEEQIKQKAIKASDKKCVKGCSKYYRYGFQDGYIIGATETTKELQEEMERRKHEADIKDLQTEREELAEHIFDDLLMNFDPEEAPSGRLTEKQRYALRERAYELAEEQIDEEEKEND